MLIKNNLHYRGEKEEEGGRDSTKPCVLVSPFLYLKAARHPSENMLERLLWRRTLTENRRVTKRRENIEKEHEQRVKTRKQQEQDYFTRRLRQDYQKGLEH